jgi:tetrapyrrole methylase family protein/MazG family protein
MLDALLSEARLRWGLDPGAGIQIVPAERLTAVPVEASRPLLVVPLRLLGEAPRDRSPEALPGRNGPGGQDPLAVLRRLYPGDHPVGRSGRPDGADVRSLGPDDLDAPLFLRPVAPEIASAGPWAMPYIAWRLRLPDGCPWDREQTHLSLRKHLLEETYEVYDALETGATAELAGELGDLLLQVILHAQLAAEAGVFDLADVQAAITRKIVRRHPHVFGEAVVRTAADVNRQWERIKSEERAAAARDANDGPGGAAAGAAPRSALDGISRSMPALAASQEMQERAAALGYDWPAIDGILAKVGEELAELAAAPDPASRREEFGDLLLVVVNVGRRLGIDCETALRAASDKFRRRFASVERQAATAGVALRDLDFAALDALWNAAKAEERTP